MDSFGVNNDLDMDKSAIGNNDLVASDCLIGAQAAAQKQNQAQEAFTGQKPLDENTIMATLRPVAHDMGAKSKTLQESVSLSAGAQRIRFQTSIYAEFVDKAVGYPVYSKESIAAMEADYAGHVGAVANKVRTEWETGGKGKEEVIALVRDILAELYKRVELGNSDTFVGCFRQDKFKVVDCDSSAIFVHDVIRAVIVADKQIKMTLIAPPSHALLKISFSDGKNEPIYFETTTGRTESKTISGGFMGNDVVLKPKPLIYYVKDSEVAAKYPVIREKEIGSLNSADIGQSAMGLLPWVHLSEDKIGLYRQILKLLDKSIELSEKTEECVYPDYRVYSSRAGVSKDLNAALTEAGKPPESSRKKMISSDLKKSMASVSWEIGKFEIDKVKFGFDVSEHYYHRAMTNKSLGNKNAAIEDINIAVRGIGIELDTRIKKGIDVTARMFGGGYEDEAYALKLRIDSLKLQINESKLELKPKKTTPSF